MVLATASVFKMFKQYTLRARVILTLLILTLTVSGVFSLAIVEVFHYIEDTLVTNDMAHKIVVLAKHGAVTDSTLDPHDLQLFANESIPAEFKSLPYGYAEIVRDDHALYVFKQNIDGVDYLLTQDQSEFEAYEKTLFLSVIIGFFLSLIAAAIVGWALGRQLIEPIVRLAKQVADPNKILISHDEVKSYSDDEIGQLAKSFSTAIFQLDEALQRERLFTSDVSHELRTSLMVISSASELLLSEKQTNDPDAEHLERIKRAATDMSVLVQTFLILARSGKNEADISKKCTVEEATAKQLKNWSVSFQLKGIALHYELMESVSDNLHNATFLDSILFNLLRNALQYTETGSVHLEVGHDWFKVRDTGIGIPANRQPEVFTAFVRGDHPSIEGFGLGLSLVKRICDHQGWTVSFMSDPAHGSEFKVTLS